MLFPSFLLPCNAKQNSNWQKHFESRFQHEVGYTPSNYKGRVLKQKHDPWKTKLLVESK